MKFALTSAKIAAIWIAIAGIAFAFGLWSYRRAHEERAMELEGDAQRCSLAFRPADLAVLTGTPADENTLAYQEVKDRLSTLNDMHPKVQYLYIYRYEPATGRLVCLVDSEPNGSKDQTPPGELFPGDPMKSAVARTIRTGVTAVDEKQTDRFGDWVSGYARINVISTSSGGIPAQHIMRLDAAKGRWNGFLYEMAIMRGLYVCLLLGGPFGAYRLAHRYSRQSLFIHKLNSAIEQSESAVSIVDLNGCIEYANAGWCRQTGYTLEEIRGKHWTWLIDKVNSGGVIEQVRSALRAGRSWAGDYTNLRKDGTPYPARVLANSIRGPSGEVVAYIAMSIDISELRKQEDILREAKNRAEDADRAKSIFLATMSHEVRTPLNGIVGFSDLLLDTQLTPEQREYVLAIHTSGEALMQLSEDILDFSRIEGGRLKLEADACDVRATVEGALDIVAPRAAAKKLLLLHNINPDVPSHVLIDSGRLRQVLVNLLGNAIKFTASGEVEVVVRVLAVGPKVSTPPFGQDVVGAAPDLASEASPMKLEFEVRDTGIGISGDDHAKLFKPFVQLDSSNARRYEGAGLGLVISYNLVRLMGGTISLSSERGHGSTFFFSVHCMVLPESLNAPRVRRLDGKRVAIAIPTPSLNAEIKRELSNAGAFVVSLPLTQLGAESWDMAVVDCNERTMDHLRQYVTVPERWRANSIIGTVDVSLPEQTRQQLRPHFRALVGKPVHHQLLIDKLVREVTGDRAASESSAEL